MGFYRHVSTPANSLQLQLIVLIDGSQKVHVPQAATGHQASWHWQAASAGPAWPCSSAESGYCVHLSPAAFLSVVVGEDICSFPLNIDPEEEN